jgi:histidinol-phosphate phosphatase family protein
MTARLPHNRGVSPKRPTQAVILAGGRGTRLKSLTDNRPKPMVEILGKPFLEYQIEQLREQGFQRVLLLLGYLPEVVLDYFGNGHRWGIKIEYSVTDVDDETGRRVKFAEPFLDPCFLLMYCDNYWPMQINKMWQQYSRLSVPAMITVYSNQDGVTRNCVRVESDGHVSMYDKRCENANLNGVEISYAILKKEVVECLTQENLSFETTVYPRLIQRKELAAFVTNHRYYSIGSPHRLPLTEDFFRRRKTVILDRDGVLNKKPPKAQYVRSVEEFEWLPGAREALRLLRNAGYRVIVVSNQAGIGRGIMTEVDLWQIHDSMRAEAQNAGGRIDAVYYCPHNWEAGCECRKPRPGMLFQAQRDLNLDLSRTFFIGDDERDEKAAEQAGCHFIRVSDEKLLIDRVQQLLELKATERDESHEETSADHGT